MALGPHDRHSVLVEWLLFFVTTPRGLCWAFVILLIICSVVIPDATIASLRGLISALGIFAKPVLGMALIAITYLILPEKRTVPKD